MPPKQVYGKRPKKAAATTSYATLLSPEKAAHIDERNGRGPERRHADIEDIEKQINTLVLGDADATPRNPRRNERKSRNIGYVKDDETTPVPTKIAVSVQLQQRSPLMPPDEDIIVFDEAGKRKEKSVRKALESRDANVGCDKKTGQKGKKGHKIKVNQSEAKGKGHAIDVENVGEQLAKLALEVSLRKDSEPTTTAAEETTSGKEHVYKAPAPITSYLEPSIRSGKLKTTTSTEPKLYADDIYTKYALPLLTLSDQQRIIPFNEWSSKLDTCVTVEKIAEASFSEVYRLRALDAIPGRANESVLKVVALRTPPDAPLPSEDAHAHRPKRKADNKKQLEKEKAKRDEEDQWKSNVDDVRGEVRLLQNLNHIPGFTFFRELTVLQGRPSATFARAWRNWNKPRPKAKKSQFPDPSKKTSFEDTQLWAVIEMQDAGTDCGKVIEAGGIRSIWEVWDIFWGVCLSVAKAEEACRFEHRDLHMDNICIRTKGVGESVTEVTVRNPLKRKLGFTGLETTVIDYTLSRADIIVGSGRRESWGSSPAPFSASSSVSSDSSNEGSPNPQVAYLDLNTDGSLFEGNAEEEYQYEIYRYMWGVVFHNDPLCQDAVEGEVTDEATESQTQDDQDRGPGTPRRSPRKHSVVPETPQRGGGARRTPFKDIWKHFHPKTNLVWVHFILHTLLQHLSSQGNDPSTLTPQSIMQNIEGIDRHAPNAAVAEKIHKKAVKLHKILRKVAELVEPQVLGRRSKVGSVRDLVVVALEMGWLGVGDVEGT